MNEITGYGKLTESGRPYYVFDNVFNEEEVNNILWEQEVIANDIKRREDTAGARPFLSASPRHPASPVCSSAGGLVFSTLTGQTGGLGFAMTSS